LQIAQKFMVPFGVYFFRAYEMNFHDSRLDVNLRLKRVI